MKQQLIAFYWEWVNHWANIDDMAEAHDITPEHCAQLIEIGRELHEQPILTTK
jgi:hypothetical protein